MTAPAVKEFCHEARELAVALNRFADKYGPMLDLDVEPPPFTEHERRRADRAILLLETAVQRLAR